MYKEMDEQENCQRDFPRCKDGSGLLKDIGQLVCNEEMKNQVLIQVLRTRMIKSAPAIVRYRQQERLWVM